MAWLDRHGDRLERAWLLAMTGGGAIALFVLVAVAISDGHWYLAPFIALTGAFIAATFVVIARDRTL